METSRKLLLVGAIGVIAGLVAWVVFRLAGLGSGIGPSCVNRLCCTSLILVVIGTALWLWSKR